jgi:protein TonB
MQQADEPAQPPPEPMRQSIVEDQIAPTPPVENPVVEAPPEQKEQPAPPPPDPAKSIPDPPQPAPEEPKPLRAEVKKKPSDTPAAPRTTAPPRAERRARLASAATAGAAAAAALPSYRDRLAAHLQRFKQYPGEAKAAGQQGVAMLRFTVSRSGQVLASGLAGSSGVSTLDAETLAMIRRAQPLPSFPPEITQSSLSFTVPVRFSIR